MTSTVPRATRPDESCDCRCSCGSLVARLVAGAVEIKCRRCQRLVRVPLEAPATTHPERAPPP